MDVELEHDAACNQRALRQMASRAGDRIGQHPDVLVVGSGDLAQSVRDRLGVGEEYQSERDGGTVAAKTLSPVGERTTIIVPDWVITDAVGVRNDGMARIIAHELFHGVLHERSEQESNWVYSQNPNDMPWWLGVDGASDWEWEQRLNVSILLDEFRVERAVHAVGWDLDPPRAAGMAGSLNNAGLAIREGLMLKYPGESMERCYRVLREQLAGLVQHVGYTAGESIVWSDWSPAALHTSSTPWHRFMGDDVWDALLSVLHNVPSAAEPMTDAAAADIISDLFAWVEQWVEHIGFTVANQSGGNLYVDVIRQDWKW